MQHNSGKLKQTNKSHKGIVTSKRAQKRALGPGKTAGKQNRKSDGSINSEISNGSVSTSNRMNRINRGQQLQKKKRDIVLLQKRVGSQRGPPKIVAIIPLSELVSTSNLVESCIKEGTVTSNSLSYGTSSSCNENTTNNSSCTNVYYNQYKAHVTYITSELNVMSVLDVAKMADVIILVVDASKNEIISDLGVFVYL